MINVTKSNTAERKQSLLMLGNKIRIIIVMARNEAAANKFFSH